MPALLGFSAAGQSASSDGSSKYRLEGTVVNSVTGAPLSRVLVEIMGNSQRVALTGADGRFQFNGMAAGQQVIMARKPGFFGSRDESRRNGSFLTVELGAQTAPLTIKLAPESVISGHVENAEGEPLENALVRVLTPLMKQGRRQWVPVSQSVTDEDGNFRIANLFASRFQVEVQPNRARGMLKEGYPAVMYYPEVYDMASATPIQLAHGQQVDLQFPVKREPVFKLSGTVSGQGPAEDVSVRVKTRSGEDVLLARTTSRQPGEFEISGIPTGPYVLEARVRRSASVILYGELPVNVAGDRSDLRLTLRTLLPVPISVRMESVLPSTQGQPDAATIARSVRIQLHSTDSAFRDNQSLLLETHEGQPALAVWELLPGSYTVQVSAWGRWYVQSARSGSTNLLRDLLVVPRNAGVEPIELVLRDDGGAITGTVRAEKPGPATVLVTPEFAPAQPPQIVPTDRNGHFAVEHLAPGNYQVLAFDALGQIEYSNPQILRQYDSRAVRVSVAAGANADVTVNLIQVGE
ncbi:MAG TPA: carboxypeptidase-like regulatory domain-containing protein [Candidatus Saccharimonadales bacterium]|nr:carboxypeptidase-like regulatory domain-containing protein [Candidatus Saccharimonadales bacterium]